MRIGYTGLITVPKASLCTQILSDFLKYSSENDWDVESNIHLVFAGEEKTSEKPLTISTWQSAIKVDPEAFKKYDFLLAEEAHSYKAKSLIEIGTRCTNAWLRIGMTGTYDDKQINKWTLEGILGPISKIVTIQELQAKGYMAKAKINCLILRHPQSNIDKVKPKYKTITLPNGEKQREMIQGFYHDETNIIENSRSRDKFIINLVSTLTGGTILVLFKGVKNGHGKRLYEGIKALIPNRKAYYVDGSTPLDEREEIRNACQGSSNSILVASYGTFAMGIDIPNMTHIVKAAGFKSKSQEGQAIGRGLRVEENKPRFSRV